MKRRRSFVPDLLCQLQLLVTGLLPLFAGVRCLTNVSVTVPAAVTPGNTVTLKCHYNMENEPLYTVKWYKGRQEFFRYIPKELPHTKVFPLPGFSVDVSKSGPNEVVLRDVQPEIAGRYRCEVSADAPSFHTTMVTGYMHVVYLPEGEAKLTMEKQRYAVGDILRGNCTSPPSNPPTNITWLVNGKKMNHSFFWRYPVEEEDNSARANGIRSSARQISVASLELDIEGSTFQYGKVRIECLVTMFRIYSSKAELVLEEERPRLASVLGTRESSLGSSCQWSGQCLWIMLFCVLVSCVMR